MRARIVLLSLLAVAASRGQCGLTPPYDACAGKACGDSCSSCAPNQPDCIEPPVVRACDPFGRCVPDSPDLCDLAAEPCAGKACGAECFIEPPCRDAVPPCMAPSVLGHCDPAGACIPGDPPPPGFCLPRPAWGCEGLACGDSCGVCPPGTDPAHCPVPTFAPTACDAQGECVTVTSWLCYDPCAGKACGDACQDCPPDATDCFETLELKACDPSGRCVSWSPSICAG